MRKLQDARYDNPSFPTALPAGAITAARAEPQNRQRVLLRYVVSLAAARSSDKEVKAVLTEVAELLHHYAEVHHALQMPEHGIRTDVAAYLRKLFTARIPSVRPDSSASRVPARLR